jgi:hypothetical protein
LFRIKVAEGPAPVDPQADSGKSNADSHTEYRIIFFPLGHCTQAGNLRRLESFTAPRKRN